MRRMSIAICAGLALYLYAGTARSEDGGAEPDLEQRLNADAQASWVLNVTDLGDILLFGGAIRVPVSRPSVERCGEWLTVPPESRAKKTDEILKDADHTATEQRMSKAERQSLKQKKIAPLRACESEFKKRCEEARTKTPLAARKQAIAFAKKSIGEVVNQKDAASARTYLGIILKQCPLEE